jgi:hypothetical protein
VAIVAVRQKAGPGFGEPVICTTEEMPAGMLAELLIGIGRKLLKESQS